MHLVERVLALLRDQALRHTAGVVAVSGGPDSIALAHILIELRRRGELSALTLAHLNHQLRGADSDADEQFVQSFGQCLDTPVHTARIDIARLAAETGSNLEDTARRERYRWLTETAVAEQAVWVATGHTADDQAETVLFRLLRGSGLQGLTGIAPRRPLSANIELVRPLLAVRRAEVLQYLGQQHLGWRDDATNRDVRFTRNRIRHELLPHLQTQYSPAVVELLCRLALQAQAVQCDFRARAAELLQRAELPRGGSVLVLRLETLAPEPAHLLGELFRRVWQREGWPMDAMTFDDWRRLADICAGRVQAWDFPGRVRVRRVRQVLQIERHATAR